MKLFLQIYKKAGVLIFLVLELLLWSILSPKFFSYTNLMNLMRQASMLGVACIGTCFVMLGGSGADLSVAGQIPLLSLLVGELMVDMGVPAIPAMIITILAGVVIGFINGLIIQALKINPFIVTLSTMNIFTGLAYLISGGYSISGLPDSFRWLGQGMIFNTIPVPVVIWVAIFILAQFVFSKTYFGRAVCAMGGNSEAARLAGINITRVRMYTFMIAGGTAAITALIMASRTMLCNPSSGSSYAFETMTCCVLGGLSFSGGAGKIWGAFVGVIVIGALNNAMNLLNVGAFWQDIILGLLFILALYMDRTQREAQTDKHEMAKADKEPEAEST